MNEAFWGSLIGVAIATPFAYWTWLRRPDTSKSTKAPWINSVYFLLSVIALDLTLLTACVVLMKLGVIK